VSIPVRVGQEVHKGDLLAVLDNPELAASLGEAKAAAISARAQRADVYSGVRAEEVAILADSMRTAEANLLLAEQQNARAVALAARDFASRQELDESKASLAKAQADLDLKRAQHAAASAGPIAEERALADATVADLQAKLDKTRLVAPVDGTVGILVAELGEVVPVGKPVMTIDANAAWWFAFTLREDDLKQLTVGSDVTLTTDDGRRIEAKVTELRPLGEFATWRAARAVGDHDLNSFRLRLDPVAATDGLQPGMTVWLRG
jgi:multidrug resistance efflux pump